MIRIGTVWDSTVDVVQGRTGILVGLATLYVFLPSVGGAAFRSFVASTSAFALVGGLISIAVTLLLVFGVVAMTAVASDPAVGTAAATRIATQRFGAALGVLAVMLIAIMIAFAPTVIALLSAGVAIDAAGQPDLSAVAPGALALPSLLLLVSVVLGIWISARLIPLFAVIVNERLGLGALRRSCQLTRGSALRLIGVIILYAIVLVVIMAAITAVVGVVARLLLGSDADTTVTFLVAVASAIVTSGATVLQTVFYTQFYVAARGTDASVTVPAA